MNFSGFLTGWLLPESASTHAPGIDSIYYFILWVTGVVFVLTEVALVYFSIKYRRKEGTKAYYSHGNTKIEIIWTVIPAMLLAYMGLASQNLWSELRNQAKFPTDGMVIRVNGEQWLWHYTFAGEDGKFETDDDLTVDKAFQVPVDKPIRFELRAMDVIHGFFIPALRLHQDAVPGMVSTVWVQPNKTGTYDVRCTQFCGSSHYEMGGEMKVVSDDEFKAWIKQARSEAF